MKLTNLNKIVIENETILKIQTNFYNTILKAESNNVYLLGVNFINQKHEVLDNPLFLWNKENIKFNLLNKSIIFWDKNKIKIIGKNNIDKIGLLKKKLNDLKNEIKSIYLNNNEIFILTENLYINYNNNTEFIEIKNIKKVLNQNNFYGYLNNDDELYLWGSSEFNRTSFSNLKYKLQNNPKKVEINNIKKFGFFKYHFVVENNKNEIFSWGLNLKGQLGLGYCSKEEFPKNLINLNIKIKGISCGLNHTLIYSENEVFGFGSNKYNQISNNNLKYTNKPILVLNSENITIKKIISGPNHNYIIMENNEIYSWGDNSNNLVIFDNNNSNNSRSNILLKISNVIKENKKTKEFNKNLMKKLLINFQKDNTMNSQDKIKYLFNLVNKLINELS